MITPALLVATMLLESLPPQMDATPVLLSGASAEMFGAGLQFREVIGGQINESGQVLAYVGLEGPGVNDDNYGAVVLVDGNNVLPVVRMNQPSPFGAPVGRLFNVSNPALANDSTVYFESQIRILNPRPEEPAGVWKYDHGTLTRLIGEKEEVGESGYFLTGRPSKSQVSRDNGMVGDGWLDRPESVFGGLIGERDEVIQVFQPSGALPGLPDGVFFVAGAGRPGMSPSGAMGFAAAIDGPGVTPGTELVMFAERDNGLELVLRTGDAAVEAGPNVRFSFFTSVSFNERRSLAFRGLVAGSGVNSTNEEAIWFENGGAPRLVAREGGLAPGFGDEEIRMSLVGVPALSGEDKVVYLAQLQFGGETEEGIFSWDEVNGAHKLVSSIEPVPGVDQELYFRTMGIAVVNGPGQVAFQGEACNGTDCFYGIWAQDLSGEFQLIVAEGQEFLVGPNDWRTVDGIEYDASGAYEVATGNESGDRIVLLDDGTLTFGAYFEDGSSGVFTIDTRGVPEPSTGLMLVLSCAILTFVKIRPSLLRR